MLIYRSNLLMKASTIRKISYNFFSQNGKVSDTANLCRMDQNEVISLLKQLPPPLSSDKHKGEAGRIGVFGGSLEYTGAPYFAAISALKVGADLSHVFCTKDAAPVIKSYSPELIVHPLLDDPEAAIKIEPWLDRLHVVLIGPGLGREPSTFAVIDSVIEMCRARRTPLVIDADCLMYVAQKPEALADYPSPVVLTPNAMEYKRLAPVVSPLFKTNVGRLTVLLKGATDVAFDSASRVEVAERGSGRRCGGQGDVLAGAVATLLAWSVRQLPERENGALVAAYAACRLVRICNRRAFDRLGRSLTCGDMVEEVHHAFVEVFGCECAGAS